jgi:hypothetical protein
MNSMEILAKQRIRGMNIGLLVGQTLLLPLPSGLRIAALAALMGRLDKSLLSESAHRRRRL